MNAGLSNLATLKAWLLPASLLTGTDYDAQIAAIGKGVALQVEGYCNRKFMRVVDDTYDCRADVLHVTLPRYPVEASPTMELRSDLATGYVAQTYSDYVIDEKLDAGLIIFGVTLGGVIGGMAGFSFERLRFTYTGGYFWEQLEVGDTGYPTEQPSGSTALPADLLLAWQLQCEHVWAQRDKLGLIIGDKPSITPTLTQIKLLDVVTDLLGSFRRFTLT